MNTILFGCGVHSIGFAAFHILFWKIFNRKDDLKTASVPTRAIIQIANLRLVHVFALVGVICFLFPGELVRTSLGHAVLLGMSLFWLSRLIEQFVFLRYNRLTIHILSALFALGAVLFALPLLL